MRANSTKQRKSFIEEKLDKIPLEKLSKETKFSNRQPKKITMRDFLLGFFLMVNSGGNKSYRNWAIKIGILIKETVSKQAIWKKMHEGQIVFLKEVLSYIIKEKIGQKRKTKLKKFRNVIIEDSTHIRLNDKLHESYPGNANWQIEKKKAILKIQSCYNLTKNSFIRFDITSFRDNDQGYSQKILEVVKKGDLLIRDLGYFVLKTFKRLNKEGVYFISKMRKEVNLLSRQEEQAIDLAKMLRKRGELDIEVFAGQEEKLPVRIIALPLEDKIANQRRRKAKSNRDKRCRPSKEHLYLLGWEIFITNVERKRLTPLDIGMLYFIRWRIEIIFKSWKTHFRITEVPQDTNKIRIESYIYSMLIFIT
ncbi:MAG: IS4 family transposase, partial [Ignavibacteria bacterium]